MLISVKIVTVAKKYMYLITLKCITIYVSVYDIINVPLFSVKAEEMYKCNKKIHM